MFKLISNIVRFTAFLFLFIVLSVFQAAAAPGIPSTPSVPDGAVNVSIKPVLDWHDASQATEYDLYLWVDGTPKPGTPYAADLPMSRFNLEELLQLGTTYRWQVIAKNNTGNTAGPEWVFTTMTSHLLGDVDMNGMVGLSDAIFILKTLSNTAAAQKLYLQGDVNGDAKLGFGDADYILQVVSENRPGLVASFTNRFGMTFKLIPAGTFMMRSPADELGREDIETLHQVTLTKPFYMMTTEVTQGQGIEVMGANPANFTDCGLDCPVENVTAGGVGLFIETLNALTGQNYRLPTEAEWEYAARAGTTTAFVNGAITETGCAYDANLDAMGWYCGNSAVTYANCEDLSNSGGPACAGPHPVAQKQPNAWGLYDMHGNVAEWVQDIFGDYGTEPVTDPVGAASGTRRVCRGGMFSWGAEYSRSAQRFDADPSTWLYYLGFRLVLPVRE